jgi:hypothetical protein
MMPRGRRRVAGSATTFIIVLPPAQGLAGNGGGDVLQRP